MHTTTQQDDDCENCNQRPRWINIAANIVGVTGLLIATWLIVTIGIPGLTAASRAPIERESVVSLSPPTTAPTAIIPTLIAPTVLPAATAPLSVAPPSPGSAGADAAPDPVQTTQEAAIVLAVNQARRARDLSALTIQPILTSTALLHSQDQAERDVLSHDGRDGSKSWDRAERAGYSYISIGENVLTQSSIDADSAFQGWWDSPPHQDNMLNANFTEIGIAFAPASSGQVYYTMVLARPS